MRDAGLELAIKAAGGVGSLARGLGIAQPSVSAWSRIPAERVLAVEALTQVERFVLRPDLYGASEGQTKLRAEIDEIDQLRARNTACCRCCSARRPTPTRSGVWRR